MTVSYPFDQPSAGGVGRALGYCGICRDARWRRAGGAVRCNPIGPGRFQDEILGRGQRHPDGALQATARTQRPTSMVSKLVHYPEDATRMAALENRRDRPDHNRLVGLPAHRHPSACAGPVASIEVLSRPALTVLTIMH